jgi:hypothetical protein
MRIRIQDIFPYTFVRIGESLRSSMVPGDHPSCEKFNDRDMETGTYSSESYLGTDSGGSNGDGVR